VNNCILPFLPLGCTCAFLILDSHFAATLVRADTLLRCMPTISTRLGLFLRRTVKKIVVITRQKGGKKICFTFLLAESENVNEPRGDQVERGGRCVGPVHVAN
jgi:hypothetical protein